MGRKKIIKKKVAHRKTRGLVLELENRTSLPTEFVHSVISWALAFLKRSGLRQRSRLELVVMPMGWAPPKAGRAKPVMKGRSLDEEVAIWVVQNPAAYPASGRYFAFPEFPEYRLKGVTDCLVAILTHELAHWMGVDGDREGEFLCEVLSSAAVADYRARYETGKLLP